MKNRLQRAIVYFIAFILGVLIIFYFVSWKVPCKNSQVSIVPKEQVAYEENAGKKDIPTSPEEELEEQMKTLHPRWIRVEGKLRFVKQPTEDSLRIVKV